MDTCKMKAGNGPVRSRKGSQRRATPRRNAAPRSVPDLARRAGTEAIGDPAPPADAQDDAALGEWADIETGAPARGTLWPPRGVDGQR